MIDFRTPRTAPSVLLDENLVSPRLGVSIDLPFGCPIIIREHLMHNGRLGYDTCVCRSDQVPLINDLEFDTLIQLINHLNPKQLIVVGIINSNLRQLENNPNDPSNHLYQIFHTLHYHLNYGRSQISACRLSINDDYRCFIYDLAQATKQSSLYGPLLIRRHHVQPGFVLIYQNGKLIFGDYIFNGYGTNVTDLKKQLNHIKQQQIIQTALPDQFKFMFVSFFLSFVELLFFHLDLIINEQIQPFSNHFEHFFKDIFYRFSFFFFFTKLFIQLTNVFYQTLFFISFDYFCNSNTYIYVLYTSSILEMIDIHK